MEFINFLAESEQHFFEFVLVLIIMFVGVCNVISEIRKK